ncbi:hypothetical protein DFH09DRAFT_1367115 [Mycena vulgaris]|nr:hypothetical protein DFH09DRAFT_1367115 [Mycena vulgaris]
MQPVSLLDYRWLVIPMSVSGSRCKYSFAVHRPPARASLPRSAPHSPDPDLPVNPAPQHHDSPPAAASSLAPRSRPCVGTNSRRESSAAYASVYGRRLEYAPHLAGIEVRAAAASIRPRPAARASSKSQAAVHDALGRFLRAKAPAQRAGTPSGNSVSGLAPRLPALLRAAMHRRSRTPTIRIPAASACRRAPQRRSAHPREHRRGRLSAAGVRVASKDVLVAGTGGGATVAAAAPPPSSLRHTTRRGPPPTPRVRVRL